MRNFPKIVDSNLYHVWTDALHGRQLAHQARNKWDRGTYVRWTLMSAWVALEIACQDALEDKNISYRFKDYIDSAITNGNFDNIAWSKGIWQKIFLLKEKRINALHRFKTEPELFPEVTFADEIISDIRSAIKDIYFLTRKKFPEWVEDDKDRGWDKSSQISVYASVIRKGASSDDPRSIHITYMVEGKEHEHAIIPENGSIDKEFEELLHYSNEPISEIRAYQNGEMIKSQKFNMRGI